MKTLLTITLIILTFMVSAQTSAYHKFPSTNAVWNFHYNLVCIGSATNNNEHYSITISGDTIVNTVTYHKLTTPYIQIISSSSCSGILTGYKGAIREDTLAKKVFYLPPSSTSEQLLYDFNMAVGDTVKGYLESFATPADTVKSIDSVLVGSSYRKRWNINNCYNIHLIEGIGSTFGFKEFSPGCFNDFPDYSIDCFMQNGQPLYPPSSSYCNLITNINLSENISSTINIFPNPSTESFTVDISKTLNTEEIRITDLLGKIVFQKTIINEQTIKIDNLVSGIYIVTIIDSNNTAIKKKIISCQ